MNICPSSLVYHVRIIKTLLKPSLVIFQISSSFTLKAYSALNLNLSISRYSIKLIFLIARVVIVPQIPFKLLQWKPLNVITLVQSQSDNINRMITIAELADNL